jgi:hypothetical protein
VPHCTQLAIAVQAAGMSFTARACFKNLRQQLILEFFVSQRRFELPIHLEWDFLLRDEDQKPLFMNWLVGHDSVREAARAYTLPSEK